MRTSTYFPRWMNPGEGIGSAASFFLASILWLALGTFAAAYGQSVPMLVSVTPLDGALNVATNSTIVLVFDQDMNTTVTALRSISGIFDGNVEIHPTNVTVLSLWSADKKTLTLRSGAGWPYDTDVAWTLNPPTNGAAFTLPRFSSASGQILATVSGRFRTSPPPPPPPKLVSVSPTNSASEVSLNSSVVFKFDQDMDTTVPLQASSSFVVGNYTFNPPNIFSNAAWSADKRTLTVEPISLVPLGSIVNWRLNPAGTPIPLKSVFGQVLGTTNGSFTIVTNTGGNSNEICQTVPTEGFGYFAITKTLQGQRQVSATELVPLMTAPASFVVLAQSPLGFDRGDNSDRLTNASLTFPNGSLVVLTNGTAPPPRRGFPAGRVNVGIFDTNTTDAVLESRYPAGNYTWRIDQIGDPQSVISISLPAPPSSIPMIANFNEVQVIDGARDFVLRWNSIAPQVAGSFINLRITDQFGKLVFAAPNECVQRMLDPTASSIVIPANIFRSGLTYEGVLEFGYHFYDSTNAAPRMYGSGDVLRATSFKLKTAGAAGTNEISPARFTFEALLADGRPELTLRGTPGKTCVLQRTDNLSVPNWIQAGSVIMDPSGNAVFRETNSALRFPAFYRFYEEGLRR